MLAVKDNEAKKGGFTLNVKEYLGQIKRFDLFINQKQEQILEIRSSLTNIVADPSKEHVSGGMTGDAPFTKTIEKIVMLEKELDDDIDLFLDNKNKIITQIHNLNNINYSCLLYERYVKYKTLEDIATAMNYSLPYVKTLHGWALLEFKKKYEPFSSIFQKDDTK